MVIPNWLNKKISSQEIDKINAKILDIEQSTSIELVPMIVRRSSTVGHVALIVYLILCLVTVVASFVLYLFSSFDTPLLLSFELLLVFGNWLLAKSLAKHPVLQRFFTSLDDRQHQVRKRAEIEFLENRLTLLPDQNAVLLMISMMERQVQVIVGDGILAKIPLEAFNEVVEVVVSSLKTRSYGDSILSGMAKVHTILKEAFPKASVSESNDFADCLIVKE